MTAQELFEILKKTGYPTRYSHFSKAQKPPFITFLSNFSNNFFADNKTFKIIGRLNYTRKRKTLKRKQRSRKF